MLVNPLCLEVLRLRAAATRITGGKLNNALASVELDGRLRDLHVYYAAHTGRYGARRFQSQNMFRGLNDMDVAGVLNSLSWERCKAEAERLGTGVDKVIATLLRPCLMAKDGHLFVICDYAAVEARCLAWLAREEALLAAFRSGADIYVEMATKIFKKPADQITKDKRWVAKQVVLGCGYSMGWEKFLLYCANLGVDLKRKGVDPVACVETYRNSCPNIAGTVAGETSTGIPYRRGGLWQLYQQALWQIVTGEYNEVHVGRCRFLKCDRHMEIWLPSGRPIVYRNVRVENRRTAWSNEPRPSVVFDHPRGARTLYGGKVTENIDQGTCRDLLNDALGRSEADGLRPVLHAHDEVVGEVEVDKSEDALRRLAWIMTNPPAWADGFPVGVEGHVSPRYTKNPWPNMEKVKL